MKFFTTPKALALISSYILILALATWIYSPNKKPKQTATVQVTATSAHVIQLAQEWAYFEGQKEALNGDVRIARDANGKYHWTESCWDGGMQPIFDPFQSENFADFLNK